MNGAVLKITGKSRTLTTNKGEGQKIIVPIEPLRVGTLPSPDGTLRGGQGMRIYSPESKAVAQKGNAGGSGAKTGLYAIPVCVNSKSGRGGQDGKQPSLQDRIYSVNGKGVAVTTSFITNVAVPIRINEDEG